MYTQIWYVPFICLTLSSCKARNSTKWSNPESQKFFPEEMQGNLCTSVRTLYCLNADIHYTQLNFSEIRFCILNIMWKKYRAVHILPKQNIKILCLCAVLCRLSANPAACHAGSDTEPIGGPGEAWRYRCLYPCSEWYPRSALQAWYSGKFTDLRMLIWDEDWSLTYGNLGCETTPKKEEQSEERI